MTGPTVRTVTGPTVHRGLVLLTRAGCHLCAEAVVVVRTAAADAGVAWAEVDVDADAELRGEWGDLVPVALLDGRSQGCFRIDGVKLTAALRSR